MVAAKDNLGKEEGELEADDEDGEEDPGTKDFVKIGRVTSHVRSANRLNVAHTRGQNTTLVVCQAGLLPGVLTKNQGKHYNAVVNLVSDAQERNCFISDFTQDSHPDSVKRRSQIAATTLQKNTKDREIQSLGFIGEGRRRWENAKHMSTAPIPQAYAGYRVPKRHTTRPIGNSRLVETADAFDDDKRRAEAASIATTEAKAENRRTLELATQESVDMMAEFPPLTAKHTSEEIQEGDGMSVYKSETAEDKSHVSNAQNTSSDPTTNTTSSKNSAGNASGASDRNDGSMPAEGFGRGKKG